MTSNSPVEATDLYRDAASYQNNGEFAVAAEEWKKFLDRFPHDPLAAKAQHYLGVCYVELKQHDLAAAAFEKAVKSHPTFELREEAYFHLGWRQYAMAQGGKPELYSRATETFREMLKQFPKETGKRTDEGLFYLGESLYAQGKKQEAAAAYAQLVGDHPKSRLCSDALYAWGVALEELGRYSEAGKAYDAFIGSCGEDELITEVRMRKAETVLQAGLAAEEAKRGDEAKQRFSEAEQMFAEAAAVKGFASADRAIVRRTFCVQKLGRLVESAELYAAVAVRFPESEQRDECVMNAARCFFRAEKYEDAAVWLQQAIAKGGDGAAEAAHWLCRIHLKRGQAEKALELASQALKQAGGGPHLVQLKMDQADSLYELAGRRAESIERYLQVAAEHPDAPQAPQALYNAAFAALELSRGAEGLRHSAAFLAAYPQHVLAPDVKSVAAECLLQLRDYTGAEKRYRELISQHADHPELSQWRVRLAMALHLQEKHQDAAAAIEPLLSELKDPSEVAGAQFILGASRYGLGHFDAAVKSLRASLLADPKWRQADETLLLLSRAQHGLKETQEAKATIQMLLDTFPHSRLLDQASYRLGEYCYALEAYGEAVAWYDKVISNWSDSPFAPYAYYGKGWAQLKSGQYAAAEAGFTKLLEKHPRHELEADTHLARGMCRRQAGRCEDAIADFGVFLQSNPQLSQKSNGRYELALASVAIGRHDAAVESLTSLLKEDPGYANADKALYELAWALQSLGKTDESAASFRRLASEHPASSLAAEAHFHVGESQYEKRDYTGARKSYEQSKQKAGKSESGEKASYKLGWALYHLEQYQLALAQFSSLLLDYPQSRLAADSLFMKAECLFRLKDYKEAFPAFAAARRATDAAAGVDPRIKTLVLLHGGQSAAQLERWRESLDFLEAIPANHADTALLPEALYEIGWAKHNLGLADEALAAFEQAAARSRSEIGARARFMMGEVCFAKKKHGEAIQHFVRVMYGFGAEAAEADVKKWQAQAGFEAARCAEVQIETAGDSPSRASLISLARKYYTYVVERHGDSELAADAKKRLQALAAL